MPIGLGIGLNISMRGGLGGGYAYTLANDSLVWTSGVSVAVPVLEITIPSDVPSGYKIRGQTSANADMSSPIETISAEIAAGDLTDLQIDDFTFTALSDGLKYIQVWITDASDVQASNKSNIVSKTLDSTAPTITSANSANNAENSTLAHALTANESVTWTITGGADAARFEISGSTLRWASNGTKDYEAPDDADTNNTYVVQVTATDAATNATNQTVTITVTDVAEGFDPLDLFGVGDDGFFFNFSDLATMTQARDGTGSAPASNGDPVGRMTDLFAGRIFSASTDAKRGTLYSSGGLLGVEFDGSADAYKGTAAWDFTGSPPEGTFAWAMIGDTGFPIVYRILTLTDAWYSNTNTFSINCGVTNAGDIYVGVKGGASLATRVTGANTEPFSSVNIATMDMDGGSIGAQIALRMNGTDPSLTNGGTYSAGSHYGNHVWFLGAENEASNFFDGVIFAMLFIDRHLTTQERDDLEAYLADLSGVTL